MCTTHDAVLGHSGGSDAPGEKRSMGFGTQGTEMLFKKAEGKGVKLELVGEARASTAAPLFSPNWNFEDMGIGGLDKEFGDIFRRAFASRIFPAQMAAKLGATHVRGMLLYGPPGTGKTLMARQIGKMLNARPCSTPPVLRMYSYLLSLYLSISLRRAQDRQRARDSQQVCGRVGGEHPRAV